MLLQAMSGAMMSTGKADQPPTPSGQFLVDAVTAAAASEATIAALLHRERTGEGQVVTINMLDVITTLQMQEISVHTVGHVQQIRSAQPHGHSYIRAPYGIFATSDSFMALAFPPLKLLGELIGEDSFLSYDDEIDSWKYRDQIFELTQKHLTSKSTAEWLAIFREHGIWVGEVYGYKELVSDPQIIHIQTFVEYEHPTEGLVKTPGFPYKFSATPAEVFRGAPQVGEHTKSVLSEIGFSESEITALIDSKNVFALEQP